MSLLLQCAEGRSLPLGGMQDLLVGAGEECALRLRGGSVPARLAGLYAEQGEAWLRVADADPLVCVNGRPVRALARLRPGDRICFGTVCADLVDAAPPAQPPAVVTGFALRVHGGPGSGRLLHGPTLHLDAAGEVVSAAAGVVGLILVDGVVHLDPDGAPVRVNGRAIAAEQPVAGGDQIQVGTRRYLLEASVAPPVPAIEPEPPVAEPAIDAPAGRSDQAGLWWLIAIAALIAATVTTLLYFHD